MADRARDKLTFATIELMRRHGVAGTGINEILGLSGVARRSIYLNFPGGKDELVAEATRAAGAFIGGVIAAAPAPDPTAILHGFVEMWKGVLADSDFEAGCPVAAAAVGGSASPAARSAAAEVFVQWADQFGLVLIGAGVPAEQAPSLASFVVAAIEGAVMLCVCTHSVGPLDDVERHLGELLALHSSTRPSGIRRERVPSGTRKRTQR